MNAGSLENTGNNNQTKELINMSGISSIQNNAGDGVNKLTDNSNLQFTGDKKQDDLVRPVTSHMPSAYHKIHPFND